MNKHLASPYASRAIRRLTLVACLAAVLVAVVGVSSANAANISWQPAPAYKSPWMTGSTSNFIGFIAPYQGINMYCWTTGSPYSNAYGTTSKWFYVRWWAVYHWLYGYVPANYVNNQAIVGHC